MLYKTISIRTYGAALFVIVILLTLTVGSSTAVTAFSRIKKLPIYSVETKEKRIAVTFDAAWSADDTEELIEILNKYNAKCTVFAVGEWLEKNSEAAKAFFESGHELANHSNTHPAFSKLSREEIKNEIILCNEKIERITDEKCKLLRAPSGDYTNESLEVTEELSMKMIQWSVDSLDWKLLTSEEMYARVISKTENGSILLFHNGVKNTPEALEKILSKLQEDGYSFVTVSELIFWENYEIDNTGKQINKKNA